MLKCSICGKEVKPRASASFHAPNKDKGGLAKSFPGQHINPNTNDLCHGFFQRGELREW